MSFNLNRLTFFLIKLLISVSIIAFLLTSKDLSVISEHLKTASPFIVILATGLLFILVIPQSFRWQSIIRASGAPFRFRFAIGATLVAWFFNQVLPSSVGGDAFRIWYAKRYGVNLSTAAQSVVYDRISALVAVTVLLLMSIPWLRSFFSSDEPVISILIFVFMLVLGCIFLLTADKMVSFILPTSLRNHIVEFSGTARKVFLSRTGIRVVFLSLGIQFCIACAMWLLAQSMKIQLELVHALLLMPVILFITAIPISIAGWGLRESAMVFVFGMIGMPAESAFSLSVSFGLVMMVTGLPGGIVWWFMHHKFPHNEEKYQSLK